ncbi:hypothetical protein M9H77_27464 [Catharanthus roseus]|uniref:Uncharacterized protein n=1 Tax=Catharanthus roseus TaxID=4058 RepID=A0ACC0ADK8_CATRO|nr:hypothetical protein M9H77_27464 [Catharanthus roseus]
MVGDGIGQTIITGNPSVVDGWTTFQSATFGISIQKYAIKPPPNLALTNGTTQTYLRRPWMKYSRTVYMKSSIDSFMDPADQKRMYKYTQAYPRQSNVNKVLHHTSKLSYCQKTLST